MNPDDRYCWGLNKWSATVVGDRDRHRTLVKIHPIMERFFRE